METLSKLFSSEMIARHPSANKLWLTHLGSRPGSFDEIDAGILAPILNSLSDGLVLTDASGEVKVFNRAALRILGRNPSLNPAAECQISLCLNDRNTPCPPERSPTKRALAGEAIDHEEIFLRTPVHPQGIFVELSAQPIRDPAGHIYGTVTLFKDISDRKAAEEKVALLASIVQATDDAIVSVNLESVFLSWNGGAERLMGFSAAEVVGNHVTVLGEYRDGVHSFIQDKIKKGESIRKFEIWRKRKDGSPRLNSLTVTPMRNEQNEVIGSCAVIRDITEEKQREEEVKRLAANLARSNEDLKQFAYVASHDIREPLRTISSFAQALNRDYRHCLDARGIEFVDFIIDGTKRMKNLVDALLDYTKVERAPLQLRKVSCGALISRLQKDLELFLKENLTEIRVESLPEIYGDEILLSQLFQNLISNAVKFCGKAAPKITLSADQKEGEWIFRVRDEGIGIEPFFADRVFQIFQRAYGPNEFPGAGIGLATCKKIVERHGGRIWFSSEPGKGTTFFFSLPNVSNT